MVSQPSVSGSIKHTMDETLRQVGDLLLRSIPTIAFVTLTYVIYKFLVHTPLVRVLDERRSKTEGAVEKAKADIAAAEARTSEYEQRLREARLAVFKAQEARRQLALQARASAMLEARNRSQAQVEQARAAIEKDKAAAQAGLRQETERLAAEIIRVVLRPGGVPAGGGR
jgi:F-type H+-transporting ATPase subunit b